LVKAANFAQREAGGASAAGGGRYSEEAQWSSDLVSAAKVVAHATQGLCEAANATVQGGAADEKLVASAKSVANSTAQLLVACRVKGAQGPSMERLQSAGRAVRKAADNLVKAAQQSMGVEEEVDLALEEQPVRAMAQELDAVEAILRQERELENAKRALAKIRANKYKKAGSTTGSMRMGGL
jgi:talin